MVQSFQPTPRPTWRTLYMPLSTSITSALTDALEKLSEKRNSYKDGYRVALRTYGGTLPSDIDAQYQSQMRAMRIIKANLDKIVEDAEVLNRGAQRAIGWGGKPRDTIHGLGIARLDGKTWVEAQRYLRRLVWDAKGSIDRI
jgi:hypothetical protein